MNLLEPLMARPILDFLVFVVGAMFGSFFNVCIHRLPRDLSIVSPRSRCPKCAKPIAWYHNVPILSFVYLGGRCSNCRETISIEYPLVELLTGLIFVGLLWVFGLTKELLFYGVFFSGLWVASIVDLHHQIIPDEISVGGIPVGFIAAIGLGNTLWWESLLGMALGGGSFFMVSWIYEKLTGRDGLGGGDVKLLGMIGAWLGYSAILPVIVISSALGSVIGILLMAIKKKGIKEAIPFGPFLALGAVIEVFWGDYLGELFFPMP